MENRDYSSMQSLIEEIRDEFPRFRIVPKRGHRLSHAIDWFLRIVTVGAQSEYITHYHTVLGDTLYVPDGWDTIPCVDRMVTLRHERVHLRQRRRYGTIPMAFLYLVPFFPLGLAYFRAKMEWEGYTESLRATAELKGIAYVRSKRMRHHIVRQFTGGAYGWMWPFRSRVNAWYDAVLHNIEQSVFGEEKPNPKAEKWSQ